MVDITLFELHLDDLDLSRARPAAGDRDASSSAETDDEAAADGGGSPVAAAVTLAFLAAVAVLAHRLLTADHETPAEEADQSD